MLRRFLTALGLFAALLSAAPGTAQTVLTPSWVAVYGKPLAVAIPPGLASSNDEFDWGTASTALNGHTPPGGLTWALDAGTSGVTSCFTLDGAGFLNGRTSGNNCALAFEYVSPTSPGGVWIAARTNPNAVAGHVAAMAMGQVDWLNITGSGTWSRLVFSFSVAAPSGTLAMGFANGIGSVAATTQWSRNNTDLQLGDTVQRQYRQTAGTWVMDLFVNGQQYFQGAPGSAASGDLSFMGVTMTPRFGFVGNFTQSSTPPAASLLDQYEVGDPTVDAMVIVQANSKVAPTDLAGNVSFRFNGIYSLTPPPSLTYTFYDASTNSAVSGLTGLTVPGLSAAAGKWSAAQMTIPAASLPSTFYYSICRTDVTPPAAKVCSKSASMSAGVQYAGTGQSLMVNMETANAGGAATGLTNIWKSYASWGGTVGGPIVPTLLDTRLLRIVDSTPMSTMAAIYATSIGASPFNMVMGGAGATDTSQRVPGGASNVYEALVDGILNRNNGTVRAVFDASGEYDADGGALNTAWAANELTIIRGLKADAGVNQVCLRPVGAYWVTGVVQDPYWERQRRNQVQFVQTYGAGDAITPKVQLCGFVMDVEHVDNYHFANAGYNTQAQRMMLNELEAETGTASYDRNGGSIVSAAFIDATHIDVTLTSNGAASAAVTNAGTSTDKAGGGLWFHQNASFTRNAYGASTPTPAQDHVPTAATCDAPSGGNIVCHFTFTGGTWTTGDHAYISGPWGAEPFNPRHDVTYHGAMATKASILMFTYADGTTAPVRPYYDFAGGNDYIVSANTSP